MDEVKKNVLRLDGSHGLGMDSYVTIITSDKVSGRKETTYQLPYSLVNKSVLDKAVDTLFILGYTIEKIVPKDAATLIFSSEGLSVDEGDGGGR